MKNSRRYRPGRIAVLPLALLAILGLVVTACGKGGGRSDRAAEQLRAMGFASVRPLCGGTQAWLQLNQPGD